MSKPGDYSIGSRVWPGLSKLIEESGEVGQVCGKVIGANGKKVHFDSSDLKERLEGELGDLLAAIDFVMQHNDLSNEVIQAQRLKKLDRFNRWHANAQED